MVQKDAKYIYIISPLLIIAIWDQAHECTYWKDRTQSCQFSSNLHMCHGICATTNVHIQKITF